MANEWRGLALTLPLAPTKAVIFLVSVAGLIDLATIKLRARLDALRTMRLGVVDGYVEPDAAGASAATLLEQARRRILQCTKLSTASEVLLRICLDNMDLLPAAEMRQSWDDLCRDAHTSAEAAQMSLCDAASFAKAAKDAIDLAGALPGRDIIRIAWFLAAEQLQNKAINEVNQARDHVVTMQSTLRRQAVGASGFLRLAKENNQMDFQ